MPARPTPTRAVTAPTTRSAADAARARTTPASPARAWARAGPCGAAPEPAAAPVCFDGRGGGRERRTQGLAFPSHSHQIHESSPTHTHSSAAPVQPRAARAPRPTLRPRPRRSRLLSPPPPRPGWRHPRAPTQTRAAQRRAAWRRWPGGWRPVGGGVEKVWSTQTNGGAVLSAPRPNQNAHLPHLHVCRVQHARRPQGCAPPQQGQRRRDAAGRDGQRRGAGQRRGQRRH